MQCPKCKLENPVRASRCDCGYDFSTNTIQESYLKESIATSKVIRKKINSTGIFILIYSIIVLFTLVSLFFISKDSADYYVVSQHFPLLFHISVIILCLVEIIGAVLIFQRKKIGWLINTIIFSTIILLKAVVIVLSLTGLVRISSLNSVNILSYVMQTVFNSLFYPYENSSHSHLYLYFKAFDFVFPFLILILLIPIRKFFKKKQSI
jgi:hypothetical protein